MSTSIAIDFIVAGGAAVGLGHVMRSAAIAEAAMQRGHSIRVFLEGDEGDEGALSSWLGASSRTTRAHILPWSAYPAGRAAELGVLDFPMKKEPWIRLLAENGSRSLVLDDPRSVDLADLTINPALHHGLNSPLPQEPPRHLPQQPPQDLFQQPPSSQIARLLEGPAYSILAETHRATPPQAWATRRNLLLSLGGADPHQATPKLAPWISETLDAIQLGPVPNPAILNKHVVLGGAFVDPHNRTRDTLREAGWHVHSALLPAQMAALMASAKLAVIGFGTSLTELAWHGTPHLSVTHHRFDAQHAAALESRGVGRHLGYAAELDQEPAQEHAKAVLKQSLCDPEWQSASADTARAMLQGGNGVERILDEIERLAQRAPRSPRENSSAKSSAALCQSQTLQP